jgi:DNA-directed RNA polymerase specialized sigma24 family protein
MTHVSATRPRPPIPDSRPLARSYPREASDELVNEAVARAKEGDMSALHFLYVRFADNVCADVRSIVRDPHTAEDMTQLVFANLTKAIQEYERGDVPFAAWITRTARDVARTRDAAGEARSREYPL